LKNGLVLNLDGQLWSIVEFQHVKPGKGGAFVRTTLKNVLSGKVVDRTFNAGTKVDTANVDKRTMTYLYREGADFVFMDGETYDQVHVPAETVGENANYLLDNAEAVVAVHDGTPLYVELPTSVELVISHTDPGVPVDRRYEARNPGDRRGDPGAAVREHRREGQGRYTRRPLPGPCQLVARRVSARSTSSTRRTSAASTR
jgi:elongation factor P